MDRERTPNTTQSGLGTSEATRVSTPFPKQVKATRRAGEPRPQPYEWAPITRITGPIPEAPTNDVVLGRDAFYRRGLALSDGLSAALAVILSISILGQDDVRAGTVLALPLIVLIGKVAGLYDRDEQLMRKTTLDEAPVLFQVSTFFTLLIWLSNGVSVAGELGRDQVIGLWSLLFFLMLLGRGATRRLIRRAVPTERCLLLGDTISAKRVRRVLETSPALKGELVAELPLTVGRRKGELPPDSAPHRETLTDAVKRCNVHRVIIAPTTSGGDETLDAIRLAKSLGVRVSVLPRLFEVVGSSAKWDDVDGLTLLGVPNYGLSKSSALLKRTMDIAGSATALTLLAPVMAVIAVAVRLSSPGPVLFRQHRIGRDGREFEMLKFRSMVDGADSEKADLRELNEAEGLFKITDDPRFTRVGRLIRRASLDELPQLINVLRGQMSLVGPRPLVPEEDQRARGWERRRLLVAPGITGVWQVLGSARVPFEEMVKLDYLYGANWSIWLDVRILVRTLLFMAGRRNL